MTRVFRLTRSGFQYNIDNDTIINDTYIPESHEKHGDAIFSLAKRYSPIS